MRVLVSGSSGLVGSALVDALVASEQKVVRLVRRSVGTEESAVSWSPEKGELAVGDLGGLDAVVHLAGENIAGRWSAAKKERIRTSRVAGTRLLSSRLAELDEPPKVLACASAIGYYGDRGKELLREEAKPGRGFLADVCADWESASAPAEKAGIRVVRLRIGMVLASAGGALAQMLTPFSLGLGGIVGTGNQYISWIALADLVGAIEHILQAEACRGAINCTSPNPVTNREFTKTLGRVLGRPTVLPMPAVLARVAFGEMADELLLASTRVEPARLIGSGYVFRFAELERALRDVLAR